MISRAHASCSASAALLEGRQVKIACRLARLVRHRAVERTGNKQPVDARLAPQAVRRRRRVGERHGDEPLTGFDRDADFERVVGRHAVLVEPLALDIVLGHRDQHARIGAGELPADRPALDQLVVDAQLDLVPVLLDALDGLHGGVPLQPDGEHVFAVKWKHVPLRHPADGRERHVFVDADVPLLEAERVHLHHGPVVGTADGRPADLRGGGDVARHQGRRHRQHVGVVVEPEAGHVARQQFGAVDLERQQVLDGVDVLDTVQPPGGDAARVGRGLALAVQGGFECGEERVDVGGVGTRPPLGGHLPAAQLPDHLLEHLDVCRGLPDVDGVERQTGGLQSFVVTGDAIAVEQRPGRLARGVRRGRSAARGCGLCACGLQGAGECRHQRKNERANESYGHELATTDTGFRVPAGIRKWLRS